MASVKVKFLDEKVLKDGTYPIAIQVIHNRAKKIFYLKHSLLKSEWDYDLYQPNNKAKNYRLLRARIIRAINDLESIIIRLENSGKPFTLLDVEKEYKPEKFKTISDLTFTSFVDNIIEQLKKEGRIGNANAYGNTKAQFTNIFGTDFLLADITLDVVQEFIHKMTTANLSINSRAVHLRELRAIINKAIKSGHYEAEKYPFKYISIKSQKTRKRAVNKDIIKMVENYEAPANSNLQFFKDIFLFSFYNRGMNFVDIAFLKAKNIQSGRIIYERQKTGQHFSIKLTEKSKAIVDKYNDLTQPESYVFPIIMREDNKYLDYKNALRLANKKLLQISKELKLETHLTTYVSRHSWATIAKKSGVATAVISEGLGHTTEEITQVYLDSFENDTLDNANEIVIS